MAEVYNIFGNYLGKLSYFSKKEQRILKARAKRGEVTIIEWNDKETEKKIMRCPNCGSTNYNGVTCNTCGYGG